MIKENMKATIFFIMLQILLQGGTIHSNQE